MNISRDSNDKPMLQWQPQESIRGNALEISSHAEPSSIKKRRIFENFVPKSRIPVTMKEVANDSFKVKQWQPQCQRLDDDSKRLCRMFCIGRSCSYGDRCRFLHVINAAEIKQRNVGSGELVRKGGVVGSSSDGGEEIHKPALWKTKLCNNWMMSGSCPYGEVCCFAHGQTELQSFGGCFGLESWIVPTCSSKNVHNNNDRNTTRKQQQQQQPQETKSSIKLKQTVKLRDIYADWIDGMTILPSPSYK